MATRAATQTPRRAGAISITVVRGQRTLGFPPNPCNILLHDLLALHKQLVDEENFRAVPLYDRPFQID